jgi:hypothetical protein
MIYDIAVAPTQKYGRPSKLVELLVGSVPFKSAVSLSMSSDKPLPPNCRTMCTATNSHSPEKLVSNNLLYES